MLTAEPMPGLMGAAAFVSDQVERLREVRNGSSSRHPVVARVDEMLELADEGDPTTP